MKISDIKKDYGTVDGDFMDLSKFDFEGVYIIFQEDKKEDKIVYIGSSYSRTIKERLKQYINANDTGNTLMHAICKKDYGIKKVKDISTEKKEQAVEKIKQLKIFAIKNKDLEYKLIKERNPCYNTAGNQIDTKE